MQDLRTIDMIITNRKKNAFDCWSMEVRQRMARESIPGTKDAYKSDVLIRFKNVSHYDNFNYIIDLVESQLLKKCLGTSTCQVFLKSEGHFSVIKTKPVAFVLNVIWIG